MESQIKLFTEKQVSVSAFFGGPIPPGLLIYKNLIRLGKVKEAYITLAATLIFSLALIFGSISLSDEVFNQIPAQVFPTIIALIVWGLYHFLLADLVREHLLEQENKESNWVVAGWTFGGMVLFLALLIGVAYTEPAFPGEKITIDNNEIYFDSAVISETEARKLGTQLYAIQYFSTETVNSTSLNKSENGYTVQLPVDREVWEDSEIIAIIYSLKWLLEADLGQEVSIILEHYDLEGNTFTKII